MGKIINSVELCLVLMETSIFPNVLLIMNIEFESGDLHVSEQVV